jgi:VanZ family protein
MLKYAFLAAFAICVLYAASDEFHQGFVADRGPSIVDVMIDSAGVMAGTLLLCAVLHKRRKTAIIRKNLQKDEKI